MDEMKKRTIKDYNGWDLNTSYYTHVRNRQKLESTFKRAARHQMKRELKKECYNQ